jgi:hypothetical protein
VNSSALSPTVYPVKAAAGARNMMELEVERMLEGVPGFDLSEGLVIVGGLPGYAAAVEPVHLQPLGTPVPKGGKTKIHFMVSFPPNYACHFIRSVNPGLVFGTGETMNKGSKLPGLSSRIVEGTVFTGLAVVWPYLFGGPAPRYEQLQVRNWEVLTGSRAYIYRVNVGVQITI